MEGESKEEIGQGTETAKEKEIELERADNRE